MEASDIYFQLGTAFVILTFVIALFGCVLPIIPGVLLLSAMVFLHKLVFPDGISWACVAICVGIGLLSQVVDFALSWFGAKKFGATWRGGLGAIVGAVIALFVPPQFITILILPFFGALIFELLGGADFRVSMKAGFGAFLGGILAMFFKLFSCAAILGVFLFCLW